MGITRRTCVSALAASTLAAPLALRAAGGHGNGPFSMLAAPLPTNAPGKIEVIEFLWYGCPHCAKVEPFVEAWEKTLPSDVVFGREHIVWEARRETLAHALVFVTQRTLDLVQYGEVIVGRSGSFAEPAAPRHGAGCGATTLRCVRPQFREREGLEQAVVGVSLQSPRAVFDQSGGSAQMAPPSGNPHAAGLVFALLNAVALDCTGASISHDDAADVGTAVPVFLGSGCELLSA